MCLFPSNFAAIAPSNPLLGSNIAPVVSDFFEVHLKKMLTIFCVSFIPVLAASEISEQIVVALIMSKQIVVALIMISWSGPAPP